MLPTLMGDELMPSALRVPSERIERFMLLTGEKVAAVRSGVVRTESDHTYKRKRWSESHDTEGLSCVPLPRKYHFFHCQAQIHPKYYQIVSLGQESSIRCNRTTVVMVVSTIKFNLNLNMQAIYNVFI